MFFCGSLDIKLHLDLQTFFFLPKNFPLVFKYIGSLIRKELSILFYYSIDSVETMIITK